MAVNKAKIANHCVTHCQASTMPTSIPAADGEKSSTNKSLRTIAMEMQTLRFHRISRSTVNRLHAF